MTALIEFTAHRYTAPGDPSWGSGIGGVTFTLADATGAPAGTATSGPNGWCAIKAPAGSYSLSVGLPPGLRWRPGAKPALPAPIVLQDGARQSWGQAQTIPGSPQIGFYGGFISGAAAQLAAITAAIGRTPTIINTAIDFRAPKTTWAAGAAGEARYLLASGTGLIPAVGLPMGSTGDKDTSALLAQIAAGALDDIYNAIFDGLAPCPPGYLRPGWEMDGNWYPWSVLTPDDATAFAAAFRHIVGLARAKLPGWRMVFNLCQVYPTQDLANAAYPGDAYVDVIGIDSYSNAYAGDHTSVGSVVALANAHGKPFAICETGSVNVAFIQGLQKAIEAAHAIEFVSIWNSGGFDFTTAANPAVASAWGALATAVLAQ